MKWLFPIAMVAFGLFLGINAKEIATGVRDSIRSCNQEEECVRYKEGALPYYNSIETVLRYDLVG